MIPSFSLQGKIKFKLFFLLQNSLFIFTLSFLFIGLSVGTFSQPLNDTDSYIRRITIDNISQLIHIVKSNDIKVELKVKSLHRMTEIIGKNSSAEAELAKKIIPQIRLLLKSHSKDTQANFNYQVRQASCSVLGAFTSKENAVESIREIRQLLINDVNHRVQTSCARVLGDFKEVPDLATRVLLEKLDKLIEIGRSDKGSTYGNSINMIVILRSVGKLASKSAFVSLMKVLQSGYPVTVKKEAEEAMERIKW